MQLTINLHLVRDVRGATDLDSLMHLLMVNMRAVLGSSSHMWYRMALTSIRGDVVTIFDDVSQLPAAHSASSGSAVARVSSNASALLASSTSGPLQMGSTVVRSVVRTKHTVMDIAVHNRQQVVVPDVQKLINQSGKVSVDIFNTRLVKPPTSVLVFPLKHRSTIFGALFCMSTVATDFTDLGHTGRAEHIWGQALELVRELCEVMAPQLLISLRGVCKEEYQAVLNATPDNISNSGNSSSARLSLLGSEAFLKMDSNARLAVLGSDTFLKMDTHGLLSSMDLSQSHSSTGALVTGLTDKLNQKRIASSMNLHSMSELDDVTITGVLGEGGFAKVFRGTRHGLVVAIKVVIDTGANEKSVIKNAHEIAIMSTLSHPHVTQAYLCLTDILVMHLMAKCMPNPSLELRTSAAYLYLASKEHTVCHLEVLELCDLGCLSTALKHRAFFSPTPGIVLMALNAPGTTGRNSTTGGGAVAQQLPNLALSGLSRTTSDAQARAAPPMEATNGHMKTLLLTLIEVASALGYLHSLGVVHCDMKPPNVLLKSSTNDARGFTAKVSDFGLSRVIDDDGAATTFPFNSHGTAAYVAPEALTRQKKVNDSVDVYAYGIMMWEMYTAQRPYGAKKQIDIVEEVAMSGLRPRFPSHTPAPYALLAQTCWRHSPHTRPTFPSVVKYLNAMLTVVAADGDLADLKLDMPEASFYTYALGGPRGSPSVCCRAVCVRGISSTSVVVNI
ncbi:hypothetical protein FOA52_011341 [Chlamydomonas sp. UWO 241]|nr:hypothetical protein FOA52_011341 [Chlamydomonas sp. UWO 241]